MNIKMTKVFIYDSLMKGYSDHFIIEKGSKQYNKFYTDDKYNLCNKGGLVFIDPHNKVCRIEGEIYAVDNEQLKELDKYYGYTGTRKDSLFTRDGIDIIFSPGVIEEVQTYFISKSHYNAIGAKSIEGGCFKQ